MTLEASVAISAMVVVVVSGISLVMSETMPVNMTSIVVSSMDFVKVSGIIIGIKLLVK